MMTLIISGSVLSKQFIRALGRYNINYDCANEWDAAFKLIINNSSYDYIFVNDNVAEVALVQMVQRIKQTKPEIKIIIFVDKSSKDFFNLQDSIEAFSIIKKPYTNAQLNELLNKISGDNNISSDLRENK